MASHQIIQKFKLQNGHILLCLNPKMTFTALFTKPPAPGWNNHQRPFQLPAPFTAYGGFINCTRQNHGAAGNREASGFVNSAVNIAILIAVQVRHCNNTTLYLSLDVV